ncbi:MAG: dihydrofolate reductase family protein [Chloroflexi bacterium]|nr:dihydrofolate reductase family protein [Chloroflexota bacterium]MCC6894898.1 dihydrofolate reductase family protein [Anaerolineae bacterium]
MRKIISSTMVSLNGVMEDPQNWSFQYMNDELMKYVADQLFASDALISGRLTYDSFSEAWSSRAGADAFADRINALPKYVASRTLTEPLTWNSTLLKGDIAEAVKKIKAEPGQDILQYGCGELTHTLIQHGLVDEIRLIVFPIAVGGAGHVFEKLAANVPMKLLSSQALSNGVVLQHYQPQQA